MLRSTYVQLVLFAFVDQIRLRPSESTVVTRNRFGERRRREVIVACIFFFEAEIQALLSVSLALSRGEMCLGRTGLLGIGQVGRKGSGRVDSRVEPRHLLQVEVLRALVRVPVLLAVLRAGMRVQWTGPVRTFGEGGRHFLISGRKVGQGMAPSV